MRVSTKEEVFELLREHACDFRSLGVKRFGLFGSFVRNTQTDESDVDLLVEFEPGMKTFRALSHLVFMLEGIFGRDVDLVTPEGLSRHIGRRILGEAEYATIAD